LNKISEHIITYGTSSNLFDLSSRDRPALKRYLFPLLYQENDDLGTESLNLDFPLIHPKGVIKTLWNPILFLLMLYTATLLPYRSNNINFIFIAAFDFDDDSKFWLVLDYIIDSLFWVDLLINFCTTWIDEDGKL
jgi:hypothetical protein